MRSVIRVLALAAMIAAGTTAALADPSPESRWSDSAELVVTAPPTVKVTSLCPGMWRLNRGETTLWVMPTLTAVPGNMKWNPACLKRRIKGAQIVLLQSRPIGVPSEDIYLPDGIELKDLVTPEAYQRLTRVARKLNVSVQSLNHIKPVWAGDPLVSAAYSKAHLHWEFHPSNLPGVVRSAGVPLREVELFTGGVELRNIRNRLSGADAEACMLSQLDRAEWDTEAVPLIAKAWSVGDMAGVIRNFPDYQDRCVPADLGPQVVDTNIKRWKDMLDWWLNQPGKTVAVVPMEWFLYKGAVLDQLKAEGVLVSAPKDTE